MMFLNEFLRRRLLLLLRPWVVSEPSVEVKLGAVNTYVTVSNLVCDVSAFNRILYDRGEPSFCTLIVFEELKVENLSFSFSNWSVPAFDVQITGVYVALAFKKTEEDRWKRTRSNMVDYEEEASRKKIIASIDPEGSDLHESLERMIKGKTSKDGFSSPLLNLFLRQLQLQIMDVKVQLRPSRFDDSLVWHVNCRSFGGKPQSSLRGIFKDFLFALVVPDMEVSVEFDVVELDIGYKCKDQTKRGIIAGDICTCVKLKKKLVTYLNASVRLLNVELSPLDLYCCLKVKNVLLRKENHGRSGKQLWRIVALNVGKIISPVVSFQKLVMDVCLWIRYLRAYKGLLSFLALSNHAFNENSLVNVYQARKRKHTVENCWEVIYLTEKKLPLEAIVQARRVARYDSKLNSPSNSEHPRMNVCELLLVYVLFLVSFVKKLTTRICNYVQHIGVIAEQSAECSIFVSCETLSFRVISINSALEGYKEQEYLNGVGYLPINCFCLIAQGIMISCTSGQIEHTFFSFKALEVLPRLCDTVIPDPSSISNSSGVSSIYETVYHSNEKLISISPLMSQAVDFDKAEGSSSSQLEKLMRESHLALQRTCETYENFKTRHFETPCLIFSMKKCLRSFHQEKFCKTHFAFGQLLVTLEFSSMISLAVLFGQMQNAACKLNSHSVDEQRTPEDQVLTISNGDTESFSDQIEKFIFGLVPENSIEYDLCTMGLELNILLNGDRVINTNGYTKNTTLWNRHHIGFDAHNIHLKIVPTFKCDSVPSMAEGHDHDNLPTLERKMLLGVKEFTSRNVVSHRCNLQTDEFFIYVAEEGKKEIVTMKSVTIQVSTFCESLHSFGSSDINVATTANMIENLFRINLVVDELRDVLEEVSLLYFSAPIAYNLCFAHFHQFPDMIDLCRTLEQYPDDCKQKKEIAFFCTFNDRKLSSFFSFTLQSIDANIIQSSICRNPKSSSAWITLHDNRVAPSDIGISISFNQIIVEISFEDKNVGFVFNLSHLQCILFQQSYLFAYARKSIMRHSENFLCEVSVRSLLFTLCFIEKNNSLNVNAVHNDSTGRLYRSVQESSHNFIFTQFAQKFGFSSDDVPSCFTDLFLFNVSMSEIVMTKCFGFKIPAGISRSHRFNSICKVEGPFRKVSWDIGGRLFRFDLEALRMFLQTFALYLSHVTHVLSLFHVPQNNPENMQHREQQVSHTERTEWNYPEYFVIGTNQLSISCYIQDEQMESRELIFEADVRAKLDYVNSSAKLDFDLSRLTVFSQSFGKWSPDTRPERDVESSNSTLRSCILPNLTAALSVKEVDNTFFGMNSVWAGQGTVNGFDLEILLSDIQVLLSVVSSCTPLLDEFTASERATNSLTREDSISIVENLVPDGAIVAIKDVHEHVYFSVHEEENKYCLRGVAHYSLVGEKALFKVKHHSQKSWKQEVMFSLSSLYAKDSSGASLQLSYRRGSSIVDLSSFKIDFWSLWNPLSYVSKNEKDLIEGGISCETTKRTFYLVNKKNDCAVAFVNGLPEFVKYPGNPFKFKIFEVNVLANDSLISTASAVSTGHGSLVTDVERQNYHDYNVPRITISFDNLCIKIVNDVLDTMEKIPLLRCDIQISQFIIQVMSNKIRVISLSKLALLYFDAAKQMWRELVHPFELFIFFRANSGNIDSEATSPFLCSHTYVKIKEVSVALSELSLDILLFILGILDFAGPFSIRSSVILGDSCKVENLSGLDIVCRFSDNKVVNINRRQAAPLRYTLSRDPPAEETSTIAIQVVDSGPFFTLPIDLSLSKSQVIAWRTRIMSHEDSKTYPGPVVIFEVSKHAEDGLLVVISPSIRIHNGTELPLKLRVRRPYQQEDSYAFLFLKKGDCIDDSMTAFHSIAASGDEKKALLSVALGNFLLCFRPEPADDVIHLNDGAYFEFSDELKGEKSINLYGIFDKLSYKVRRALSADPAKYSFTTASCVLKSGDENVASLHFLVKIISREVPISSPSDSGRITTKKSDSIALLEQKEIFILPTVRVLNILHTNASVLLTENDPLYTAGSCNIVKERTIPHGSTAEYYVHPSKMFFLINLTEFNLKCKPVNAADCAKKLKKDKDNYCLDIQLDFGHDIFASLRISRGSQGVLEATIFTPYHLKNESDVCFIVYRRNQKLPSRNAMREPNSKVPFDLYILQPRLTRSWFSRSNNVVMKIFENGLSEARLDLSSLTGVTEAVLESDENNGNLCLKSFGISIGPSAFHNSMPSQMVSIANRQVLYNDSDENISICPLGCEDEVDWIINVDRKQKATLRMQDLKSKNRIELSIFENIVKKHRNENYTKSLYIKFRLNKSGYGWSGPICTSSIGRVFLKFRNTNHQDGLMDFALVEVVQEGATLAVHFRKAENTNLPYLLENRLPDRCFTYYQKDSSDHGVLGSKQEAYYAWDDLTLPHKLVILIEGTQLLREVRLNKLRQWKSLVRFPVSGTMTSDSRSKRKPVFPQLYEERKAMEIGYEVYADGPTRVLRVCQFSCSKVEENLFKSRSKIQLRVHRFTVHMLEQRTLDMLENKEVTHEPMLDVYFGNLKVDCLSDARTIYNTMTLQTIKIDPKWQEAPYGSIFRRHNSELSDSNSEILKVNVVLLSNTSNVRHVKFASFFLQPIDLNMDEETLMKIASFWRTSFSTSSTPYRLYYFDHFEIHPIKIVCSFLPGESYSSYNSAQEVLRTLLHSIVKVPSLKNVGLELNGVLVTHALLTTRELLIRCSQHYSWYAMRSIYIAKGSSLLPPAFASIFDDLSSSSIDVFFDPSTGFDFSGATIRTLKFLSKSIDRKGFGGTKRYIGDLGKTLKTVGSNVLFAVTTEITDSVLAGAEANGFDGMINGFHHGILKLAMEPTLIGSALMRSGPDRKIKLDRSPGVEEMFIEGYIQAMLDCTYRQEYLRVKVVEDQVYLKNLPPNTTLITEIVQRVKDFLVSKGLINGDPSSLNSSPHLLAEREWKLVPTVMTLFEHLFVSFAIRFLRSRTENFVGQLKKNGESDGDVQGNVGRWKWGIGKFAVSAILAYIDGRLCRAIPNPLARRIVSGYLLTLLDNNSNKSSQ